MKVVTVVTKFFSFSYKTPFFTRKNFFQQNFFYRNKFYKKTVFHHKNPPKTSKPQYLTKLKTQNVTEPKKKTTNVAKLSMLQNLESYKTQNSTFENSKLQKVTKHKKSKCDKSQKLEMRQNSKT